MRLMPRFGQVAMNSTALSNKPGSKKRPRDILIPVSDAQHFHHDDLTGNVQDIFRQMMISIYSE